MDATKLPSKVQPKTDLPGKVAPVVVESVSFAFVPIEIPIKVGEHLGYAQRNFHLSLNDQQAKTLMRLSAGLQTNMASFNGLRAPVLIDVFRWMLDRIDEESRKIEAQSKKQISEDADLDL